MKATLQLIINFTKQVLEKLIVTNLVKKLHTKVHYYVHNSLPLVPILSQLNPSHTLTYYLRYILKLSSYPCLYLQNGIFPLGPPVKIMYEFLIFPTYLLDFITLKTFGGQHKLRGSSLCNFLQPSVTFSLLRPNISSTSCSQTPSIYIFP
jgi:hypothetical protein